MTEITEHLEWLRLRGRKETTITQRRYALRRLCRTITPTRLLDATADDLVRHVTKLAEPESRATEISHLKQFYKWAVRTGQLETNPSEWLDRPKLPRRLPNPMFDPDLFLALDLAPERIRPWLLLGGWAGLRAKEIAQLRAEELWFHDDPPLIIVRDGKGGQDGAVPPSRWLVEQLALSGLPGRGWLFPRRDGKPGPTPPHVVSQLTNRFLHEIGIDHTLHSCRHRYATQVYKTSGRDLRQTQEMLRHRSVKSTEIYTFVDPREAAQIADRLPTPDSGRAVASRAEGTAEREADLWDEKAP